MLLSFKQNFFLAVLFLICSLPHWHVCYTWGEIRIDEKNLLHCSLCCSNSLVYVLCAPKSRIKPFSQHMGVETYIVWLVSMESRCLIILIFALTLRFSLSLSTGQRGMSAQYDVEKHRAHTHLAHRLPLWSASPFVRLMLIKSRQRQTHAHTCTLTGVPFNEPAIW